MKRSRNVMSLRQWAGTLRSRMTHSDQYPIRLYTFRYPKPSDTGTILIGFGPKSVHPIASRKRSISWGKFLGVNTATSPHSYLYRMVSILIALLIQIPDTCDNSWESVVRTKWRTSWKWSCAVILSLLSTTMSIPWWIELFEVWTGWSEEMNSIRKVGGNVK